jgi:gas vesicle protein
MRPINVEILQDHKTGLSDSYYRITEDELLQDYLRAVDYLTVNKDQKIANQLQKQVAEFTEKNQEENDNLKKHIEELKQDQDQMIESVKALTRMDEYLYLFRDDQLPQNIETMLQGFL